jgi:hypothetical protein
MTASAWDCGKPATNESNESRESVIAAIGGQFDLFWLKRECLEPGAVKNAVGSRAPLFWLRGIAHEIKKSIHSLWGVATSKRAHFANPGRGSMWVGDVSFWERPAPGLALLLRVGRAILAIHSITLPAPAAFVDASCEH